MRDGTTLYADVWRPEGEGRFPVLLQRVPYDKSASLATTHFAGLEPLRAVEGGYAVVIQDTRGRFVSEGEFCPFVHEASDGADTVSWAAEQPFSNGTVGMYGVSYFGATQLLAATQRPPALRAIAPHLTSSDYYEGWTYQGGAFQLGFALLWAAGSLAPAELQRRRERGENVDVLDAALTELQEHISQGYRRLPVIDQPALIELVPAYRDWLLHPERDAYWQATACDDAALPGLHIGGWYDVFLKGTLAAYTAMQGRAPQRLIVGPWAHAVPYDVLGERDFGPQASQPALDMTTVHLDWFEPFLHGRGTTDETPVRLFVMGANRWRDEDGWPLARARPTRFFLRSKGILSLEAPPATEEPDEFVYDPLDPLPTIGGPTFLPGLHVGANAGPRDQRMAEHRTDVLVYRSEPLTEDTEVTGPVTVSLRAATSGPDTDWTARLVDIHPDGRALLLAEGILRARYRHGCERPEVLEAGRVYSFEIDLVATSNVFLAGHRIGLYVSSSSFPRFDRNPNTGATPATATESEFRPARQIIFHDADRPSFVLLPIVPDG